MMKLTPFQWSAFNFFGFYCAYGVVVPFIPAWLSAHGYETETIGLLASLGYLMRFIGSIYFPQRISEPSQLIPLTRLLAWLSVILSLALLWTADSPWLLLPLLCLFHWINGGSMPINETIASTWQQQAGINYGRARLFGSVAFVIGSSVAGMVMGISVDGVMWLLAGYLLLLAGGQMFNPTQPPLQSRERQESALNYWQIFKQPTTWRTLMAVSLIQAGHAAYYTYSNIYWQSQGISIAVCGLLWALAVVAEVVLFFTANRFFRRWTIRQMLILTALIAVIRWAVVASTTNIALLALAQLGHAFTFGLTHLAMVRYISTQDTALMPKLQGLYFALSSCGLIALFTLLSGVVYALNPPMIFWMMVLVVLPAFIIVPKDKVTLTH